METEIEAGTRIVGGHPADWEENRELLHRFIETSGFFVCVSGFCPHVCMHTRACLVPTEARRWQVPGTKVRDGCALPARGRWGSNQGPFEEQPVSAFNCRAIISPAPPLSCYPKCIYFPFIQVLVSLWVFEGGTLCLQATQEKRFQCLAL